MDLERKGDLVKRPPTEEVITDDNLKKLLENNDHPEHYIGFEISGFLHLGSLFLSGYKINDLAKAGFKTKVYLADWHSVINDKLEGNWEKILIAEKYYKEAFKLFCPKTEIINGSELYHKLGDGYWKDVLLISKKMTLARATRTLTIMGRDEKENLDMAQYFYPPMQATDIKYLGNDLPHGGMDQRKIHVLAKEVFSKLKWNTPVPLHHHLLGGLAEPGKIQGNNKLDRVVAAKMSKSKPWTAVFIHDSDDDISNKLKKAWCPEKTVDSNPVIDLVRHVIFHENRIFGIHRHEDHGGTIFYKNYEDLERDYSKGVIHPKDLKDNVAREISKIIKPVRKHFESPSKKKLLEVYKDIEITR